MRRLALCVALCLLARGPSFCAQPAASACGISDTAWSFFRNYVAWADSWWNRGYVGDGVNFRVEAVRDRDRAFWFLPASKFLIGYWPGDKGSQIAGNACDRDSGDWIPCIPPMSFGEVDIAGMLMGRAPPPRQPEFSAVCKVALDRAGIRPWRPSADSPEKKAILARIEAALRQAADRDGSFVDAVLADFNVLDPVAYALARVKSASGRDERVLMFVDISSAGAVSAKVTRREDPGAANSRMVERILARGIEIR